MLPGQISGLQGRQVITGLEIMLGPGVKKTTCSVCVFALTHDPHTHTLLSHILKLIVE